jgi:hypothetical protein
MTISKDELVEICSSRPEAVDEDARGAAEAVGPSAATTDEARPTRVPAALSISGWNILDRVIPILSEADSLGIPKSPAT